MLNRKILIEQIKSASHSGSLLTPKHDPNNPLIYKNFRTVLTQEASGSLQQLIDSEQYDFEAYFNKRHNKYSYKLVPYDSALYSAVGLGILSGSLETTGSYDIFLLVSGSSEGWHIYSEDSARMESQLSSGILEFRNKL